MVHGAATSCSTRRISIPKTSHAFLCMYKKYKSVISIYIYRTCIDRADVNLVKQEGEMGTTSAKNKVIE